MMTEFYAYNNKCLCRLNGSLPKGAVKVPAPFFPLLLLKSSDPLFSRAAFPIYDIREALEPEGPGLLLALPDTNGTEDGFSKLLREKGARVVNSEYPRYEELIEAPLPHYQNPVRVNIAGLGDVGGTLLTGLRLLGSGTIKEIGIYDPDLRQCMRYEQEINQILPIGSAPAPHVGLIGPEELFDCNVFIFAASVGVPPISKSNGDVRMAQLKGNQKILLPYARMAREKHFKGLFAVVSDPVDPLCRSVFLESNQNENGAPDFEGLFPEQVRGFGLGVMAARALYCANKRGAPGFFENGRVFGPHGIGLIAANDFGEGYDAELSELLSNDTAEANLKVRETGFKPYIAPALSSACVSILKMLQGEWHDSAIPLGGIYFGCRSRLDELGVRAERLPLHPALFERIQMTYIKLKESLDALL